LFAATGADVIAADVSQHRVDVAKAYGLNAVNVASGLNEVLRQYWPHGADVVVDATGRAAVLRETTELVRDRPWEEMTIRGGKLVVQGSYSGNVPFPQDIAFQKEAEVLWPRDCMREDLLAVLGMLESGTLRVRDLVGAPRPIATAPEVYAALQRPNCPFLTASFDWTTS
jgi:threonine dehydrogenase-like Zn-dependent dehydrogenase